MRIKQVVDDFAVREMVKDEFFEENKGSYKYFILKKINWNTLDVIEETARKLGMNKKEIGYAGNKDKNAVTEQVISIKNINKDKVENLKINNVELKYIGSGNERTNLGDLKGNEFRIIVRDLDKFEVMRINKIKNYFGEQRFGKNNVEIGRSLIKNSFEKACCLIGIEAENYVNELRRIGNKRLLIYLHAYQSYLFNKFLDLTKKDYGKIPLIGFLTRYSNKDVEEAYKKILKEERIKEKDFLINEFKNLSLEGGEREMYMEIKDFSFEIMDDELNKGKKKVILEFKLDKGCYGTEVVKQVIKEK